MKHFLRQRFIGLKARSGLGSEPDFLILGAQKAGTTSLYRYMEKFGVNFRPPLNKELWFFTEGYDRGWEFYRSRFPAFKKKAEITGEATPDYLYYHKTPERVFGKIPEVKLIILLRDPIARAFSQYNHQNFTNRTHVNDPFSFSRAIRIENERYCIQEKSRFFHEYKYYSYLDRGDYVPQIKRWLEYFDRDRMMFLDTEDLNSKEKLKEVFEFLDMEVDKSFSDAVLEKHNSNEYSEIDESDYLFLVDYYKSKFDELENITGKKYWWQNKYMNQA